MTRFSRFAVVGGFGFAIDAGILVYLLVLFPAHPFLARLGSIAVALFATWLLNRTLTFGPSGRTILAEGTRYYGIGFTTSLVNYLTYSALLFAIPSLAPLAALAIASLAAMLLSFFGYDRLVFSERNGRPT